MILSECLFGFDFEKIAMAQMSTLQQFNDNPSFATGAAFIEFYNEEDADMALRALQRAGACVEYARGGRQMLVSSFFFQFLLYSF